MKILIIDNYDSFTYNLHHYIYEDDVEVHVRRNNEIKCTEIEPFDKIIISPGPGLPSTTPLLFDLLEMYAGQKPILGVCLGMQAIAEFYGGKLINQPQVRHGIQMTCYQTTEQNVLLAGIAHTFDVGLYHSWKVDENTLPKNLRTTSFSEENVLMSIEDVQNHIYALQFHPESIMTPDGREILKNFCSI